jgi:hypothetical protein
MMNKSSFMLVLCALTVLAGCGKSASPPSDAGAGGTAAAAAERDATDHSEEGHSHGAGPHEGTIADWGGGKYHVEFTVDHDKQQATAYILGGDEKTPSPIDAESIELSIQDPAIQVTLKAESQAGDPDGKSSRFVGTHEKLGVVQEYAGTLTGVVAGTPYSGDFKEGSHAHEH